MPFAEGETVGAYRITNRLGQGGMATVFRAYHPNLDRYVAIKVLHNTFKDDPSFLARFQREAQIVAKLEHPNIVPIYDFNEHNGEPYLVMKFIEGDTLKARLQSQPLTLNEALSTMTSVGQALTYAHERGVLHRDVKPSNILIEKNGTPYLADFGLARMASAGESTMSQDMMLGTPQYISPEQAQGIQDLDGSTDIYSLGVVLYELVVGRVPFNADTPYAIVHDHIYAPLPLPTKANPSVPPAVERVLLKALAKDRADRYATATGMVEAFREAVRESEMKEFSAGKYRVPVGASLPYADASSSTPAEPSVPAPVPPAAGAATRRNPQSSSKNSWLVLGVGLVIFLCIGGLLLALSRRNAASGTVQPTVDQIASGTPIAALTTVTSTSKPTLNPVEFATEEVVPTDVRSNSATNTPAPGNPSSDVATIPPDTRPLPPLTAVEAQRQLNAHPDDPRTHFNLALALMHERRPLQQQRAFQEFQAGMNLTANDPALAAEIAEQLVLTPDTGALPAFEYAVAYNASGDNHPNIRNEAGRYLYKFVQNAGKVEKTTLDRWNAYILTTKSAGLYAFAALEAHTLGHDDAAGKALGKAISLDANLPEVYLVQGILATDNISAAQKNYNAAITAYGAPDWVISAAKSLIQKG